MLNAKSQQTLASAAAPAPIGGCRDRLMRAPDGWRFAERVGFLDFRVELE